MQFTDSQNRVLVVLVVLTIGLCRPAFSQQVAQPRREIYFTLTEQNNIVVNATINDADKLNLMLHTAASDVTLTEEGTKKAKTVKFTDAVKVESWGGDASSRISKGNLVQIGELQRKSVNIFENKYSGKDTDGKFGLDFFEKRVVEINFDTSKITVYEKAPDKLGKFERLKIENQNGHMLVEGSCLIEGKSFRHSFLVHTGYSGGILLDDAFAAKTGVDGKVKIVEESSLKDSFGNVIKVKNGVLPEFSLGGLKMVDAPVGFFAGGIGNQKMSVIGCEVLKRFNLIFDVANNDLYLTRRLP